jgi:hypothetical protein
MYNLNTKIMKKTLLFKKLAVTFLAVLLVIGNVHSQIAQLQVNYVEPTAITIDGLGNEWSTVSSVPIALDFLASNPQEADFKASFKARWSDENLYMFFEIKDDFITGSINRPDRVWLGDHIEIATTFHTDEVYDVRATAVPTSTDDAKIFFSWSVKYDSLWYQLKNTTVNFEYKKILVTGGYNVELKMPFVVLYPNASIKNGDSLRVEITAGDSEDGNTRKHQMRWSGNISDINRDFSGHGKFTFVGKQGTGVNSIKNSVPAFYPNPVNNMIYFSNEKDIRSIDIYDVTGKAVLSRMMENSSNTSLDASGLKTGIYIINIKKHDGSREIGKLQKL